MVLNVHRNRTAFLGTGRMGLWRWGEREPIYLSLHCHHQNDFCIKMGSDESHFNVTVESDGQSHKTVPTNHNLSEEKGEPKRYRTEVLPLTSLSPYRWAKPAHVFLLYLWLLLYLWGAPFIPVGCRHGRPYVTEKTQEGQRQNPKFLLRELEHQRLG